MPTVGSPAATISYVMAREMDGDPDPVTATLAWLAPTVDPQTRNALVYVDLKGAAPGAKAGMFARGEFELGSMPALTVPQQAVVVREGFSYVFRVNKDQRVSQLKVQTGRRVGERIEILSGVKADMPVVLSGAGFLNDGDLVRVANAAAATPARSAAAAPAQAPVQR